MWLLLRVQKHKMSCIRGKYPRVKPHVLPSEQLIRYEETKHGPAALQSTKGISNVRPTTNYTGRLLLESRRACVGHQRGLPALYRNLSEQFNFPVTDKLHRTEISLRTHFLFLMEHVGSLPRSQDLATAQYAKRDQSSADPTNFCAHVAITLNFRGMISKLHSVMFLIRKVGNTEIVTTPTAKHRFRVGTLFAYI